jgi:hypothetical protein
MTSVDVTGARTLATGIGTPTRAFEPSTPLLA